MKWSLLALFLVPALALAVEPDTIQELRPYYYDIFPAIYAMEREGSDIVFNQKFRLKNGDFSTWPNPVMQRNSSKIWSEYQIRPGCLSKPQIDALSKKHEAPMRELYCDATAIWLASQHPCQWYGARDNFIVRISRADSKETPYRSFLNRCESVIDMVAIDKLLWLSSTKVFNELERKEGQHVRVRKVLSGTGLLVLNPEEHYFDKMMTHLSTLGSRTITSVTYFPDIDQIWFAHHEGISIYHRYSKQWGHWYFHPIEENGIVKLYLKPQFITPEYRDAIRKLLK